MGIILLVLAVVSEVGFLIWSVVTKEWHKGEKLVVRVGSVLLMAVLLLTGVLDGVFRYGALMAILAIQCLICGAGIYSRKKQGREEKFFKSGKQVAVFIGNVLLYSCSLFPAILFPQYEEPQVTGTKEVVTAEYTWVDEGRTETYTNDGTDRELTVKFWYPKEEGNYPLVVFSHGAFGVIDSNNSTCVELASNGYVVASIGHTYQSMFVQDTNGKVIMASQDFLQQVYEENGADTPEGEKIVYDNSREFMAVRSADANFVLDTIIEKAEHKEDGPFAEINTEKIGMFGHSMGGATAVEMGRERNDIDAVIDLEGTMFGEYVDFKDGTEVFNEEPYPVPLLDVNSADIDAEARRLTEQGDLEYVNFYVGEHAADYHYAVVEDAGHLNFTDLPMVSPVLAHMLGCGTADPKECIEEVNALVLGFFDEYLK